MNEENYISRKQQLLKDFDKSIARINSVLTSRFGNEEANSLISESRFEMWCHKKNIYSN